MRPTTRPVQGLLLLLAATTILACAPDEAPVEPEAASNVQFEVVPDYVEPAYENTTIGIRFRPPLGWEPLEPEQREQVADALLADRDSETYSLRLVDLFLRAETLSFAVLSRVTLEGEPIRDVPVYVAALEATLGPAEDDIRSRADFVVGAVPVTQIRHATGDRIAFTLVFPSVSGEVIQLDYSIPAASYEEEGIKLESSIGTIQRIGQETEEG